MAPYLSIAGFTVPVYALSLILGVGAGLWLAAREAKRRGLNGDHVYNLGFYAILAALLGARLVYVLGHWAAYRGALLSALSPTPTALAWPEGALIGGLTAVVYWSRSRLPVGATLDAIALGLALALAVVRLGNFFDGSGFGEPTMLPWGVAMWDAVRHPVQLYGTAVLLGILGILWWRRAHTSFDGGSFVLFVALYAGSRLFLEAFRADAPLLPNGVRMVQVVALVAMLGAVGYLYRQRFAAVEAPSAAQEK
ncbi:MAG: prolipoprotein diacylglyceryl transferase [Anaerolineae bacterium]|nr:MAG: prolipoprotein diacylglyceryl transferase [Anaerolineae bacterium]